LKYWF